VCEVLVLLAAPGVVSLPTAPRGTHTDARGVFDLTPPNAPGVQGKDGVGTNPDVRPEPAHRSRKKHERSRIFRELVHIAAEQGASVRLGISTAEALQECLDRAVSLYRFASDQVDNLTISLPDDTILSELPVDEDPLFEVYRTEGQPPIIRPHRYALMEKEARIEVEKLAAMMTQLGIAERVVRVQEAQAALLVAAVRDAAIEAGIPNEQVRALGAALRHRIEGGLHQKTAYKPIPEDEKARAQRTARASREIESALA
jgi:hypothetical protein